MLINDQAARFVQSFEPHLTREQAMARYWTLWHSDEGQRRLAAWGNDGSVAAGARQALLPGLLITEERWHEIPRQWPRVFKRMTSAEAYEKWEEKKMPGYAQLRPKGAPTVRDNGIHEDGFKYFLNPYDIALATAIRDYQIEDGSFLDIAHPLMFGLAESCNQSQEIMHANVLQTGRVYNSAIVGDGVPLFSEHHPTKNGTYSNIMVPRSYLNEGSLEAICGLINALPLVNDTRSRAKPRLLIVPIQLQFTALRLFDYLKNQYGRVPEALPQGYQVLDYLEDPEAWYVTTSIDGLVSVEWEPFKLDLKIEEGSLIIDASHSYGCGHINPRGIMASFPEQK